MQCLFNVADTIVDTISFIRHIVLCSAQIRLWSDFSS